MIAAYTMQRAMRVQSLTGSLPKMARKGVRSLRTSPLDALSRPSTPVAARASPPSTTPPTSLTASTTHDHAFTVQDDDVADSTKLRLDAFLAQRITDESTSRARLQATIKDGKVTVNGKLLKKPSHVVKVGDLVACTIIPPAPLRADPEDIPLDIVYEDDDVIVIHKSAAMVMHPSPGHCSGTMVNALLHHCGISEGIPIADGLEGLDPSVGGSLMPMFPVGTRFNAGDRGNSDEHTNENDDDEEDVPVPVAPRAAGTSNIRPGIVHRLDKGTTGLVVVAKTDVAHRSLSKQFKDRTIDRTYLSITLGVPKPPKGRIVTNIGRDFRDRKKMSSFEYACTRGKPAASNYEVLETLGLSQCALVSWKLETGRTHQIRVHAKHMKHPLLNDDTYAGTEAAALRIIGQGKSLRLTSAHHALQALGNSRPALHAHVLGFTHPTTGAKLRFVRDPPEDFTAALETLRAIN